MAATKELFRREKVFCENVEYIPHRIMMSFVHVFLMYVYTFDITYVKVYMLLYIQWIMVAKKDDESHTKSICIVMGIRMFKLVLRSGQGQSLRDALSFCKYDTKKEKSYNRKRYLAFQCLIQYVYVAQ